MSTLFPHYRQKWLTLRGVGFAALGGLAIAAATLPVEVVQAQSLNDRLAAPGSSGQRSRMLVDAREIVYDRDNDRVTALGDVQLHYQGKVLEADKVTYDRKLKRVYAEGNAKLTDADGTKTYGNRFDLTDDFRDGFIDSLRVESTNRTRLSSARAERTDGETTVFERGTFTSCEACKDNPERPPLWQVKAARIIHRNNEKRIYYENATLEFWGIPVAYFPFFSAPDPSVKNASGILAPRLMGREKLGFGVGIPLFWSIAPNYDLLFIPTHYAKQGFHADLLWRHRLQHGSYNIRVNGINQNAPREFNLQPYAGAGLRRFRGSIETRGRFYLNEKWTVGWDLAWATDKHYYTDYKTKPQSRSALFYTEQISQIYLRGRGARSWFDLTGYHFYGLTSLDWQKQLERVGPSFDFDRRFNPDRIGGELRVNVNGAAIQRDAAVFQPLALASNPTYLPGHALYATSSSGLYRPCVYNVNGQVLGSYRPGQCLLRGFAGEYVRTSVDISWRRQFIDPIGQEWTPFVSLRADAAWLNQNLRGVNSPDPSLQGFVGPGYGNANQANFLGGNADNFLFRPMPTVGVEYRYPFVALTSWGAHHIEPIAQLTVRPNETRIGKLPNEDAQSLVFDENSIFSSNRFSGYDRVEGGTRVNYGARYTFRSNGAFFTSLMVGQSRHLLGRNSYAARDLTNTGRNSGLDTRLSDVVTAATIQPFTNFSVNARGRFDEKTLGLRRADISATALLGPVSASATYSRIAAQPEIGYPFRREGLLLSSTVTLPRNFYVTGSVLYDMDRYLTDRATASTFGQSYSGTPWRITSTTLGFGYRDECTDLSLTYTRSISGQLINTGAGFVTDPRKVSSLYMVRLVLRELLETRTTYRPETK